MTVHLYRFLCYHSSYSHSSFIISILILLPSSYLPLSCFSTTLLLLHPHVNLTSSFLSQIRHIFDKFVETQVEECLSKCRDDLKGMTRFVTWDVDGKGGSSALYKYVTPSLSVCLSSIVVVIYFSAIRCLPFFNILPLLLCLQSFIRLVFSTSNFVKIFTPLLTCPSLPSHITPPQVIADPWPNGRDLQHGRRHTYAEKHPESEK